jgi:hypothetical protein
MAFVRVPQCGYGVKQARMPFTQKEGPRHQDHMAMNARVLNSLLAQFRHNEQKDIAKVGGMHS